MKILRKSFLFCIFVCASLHAEDQIRYVNYASPMQAYISLNTTAGGYATQTEIFDLHICSEKDPLDCYFTDLHTFAIPKQRPKTAGDKWEFRGLQFQYVEQTQIKILGVLKSVMRIEATKHGKIVSTFLFSPQNGLLGIIEPIEVGGFSSQELFISEDCEGFAARK